MQIYLLLGGIALFALIAVGVKEVVDTYTEAIAGKEQAVTELSKERGRHAATKSFLHDKQEALEQERKMNAARGARERQTQEKLDEAERKLRDAREKDPSVDAFLRQPVPAILREHGGLPGAGGADPEVRRSGGEPAAPERPAKN